MSSLRKNKGMRVRGESKGYGVVLPVDIKIFNRIERSYTLSSIPSSCRNTQYNFLR